MNFLYLVAFIFALSGWGILVYLPLFRQERSPLERFLIIQAIGFTLSWLFIFIIAAFHLLNVTLIHLWVLSGAVIYLLMWRKEIYKGGWWNDLFTGIRDHNQRALVILLSSFSMLAYLVFLYFAQAPTTTWDPLDYHYVMPREWLLNGGFKNLPLIMYSNFPASTELIWLIGMALHGEIVSNLFTWWFGMLMGLTIIMIGSRWFSTIGGWIGLVLFIALPIVYTEEMPGGVIDLAVFTVNLLALYFTVRFISERQKEDFIIAVIFASNSLAMKHSSLLTVLFCAGLIFVMIGRKDSFSKSFKYAALLVILAFILPLPWYIKSFIYTGNPVYPFLEGIFHPKSDLSIDILYWSNPNFTRGFFDWITYWYRVVSDVGMVQFRFRLINGIYLGMLPLIYWAIRKPGYHRTFITYAFFTIILLLYQAPGEPRYQLAAWAIMGIAYGFGLYESGIMRDSTMRILVPLAVIIPITLMLVMCVHENRNKNGFIMGNGDFRQYYLENVSIFPLIDYMNKKTPEDSCVIWCDPRVYLFHKNYIPAYPFDTGNLPSWKNDPAEIVKEWKELGVTHLGFTMAANYRAWVTGVLLEQAQIDGVTSGVVYIEDMTSPGIKYEEGDKLDFGFNPMSRQVQKLGPLTPRALQLASYSTKGLRRVFKDDQWVYRADLDQLINNRTNDIDVIMIRKLIKIGNKNFLRPVEIKQSEGILFEINYKPLEWVKGEGES